jgi:hypothetical protein
MAPATADVVLSPVASAMICTSWPRPSSSRVTASPTTPAPTTVTCMLVRCRF